MCIRDSIENAATKLEQIDLLQTSHSEINEMFVTCIYSSAEEAIPTVEKSRLYQPWRNDEELKRLYELKDELTLRNNTKEQFSVRKRIRRLRLKHLRNQFYKSEAENINQFAINRELDKLFSRAKNQETTLKSTTGKCPPEKLPKHFQSHFNPNRANSVIPEELSTKAPDFHLIFGTSPITSP